MFPAARVLDPITHDQLVPCGTIVGPGCPTVIIEYMPAVRGMPAMDGVACTGVISGGIAHPPPPPGALPQPIAMGSTTVLIGYMPAARWIVDTAGCGVFLGDLKLVATRTVFIGG
jgi:uncharacterized Zn-binding protein involved in type VI secretion